MDDENKIVELSDEELESVTGGIIYKEPKAFITAGDSKIETVPL